MNKETNSDTRNCTFAHNLTADLIAPSLECDQCWILQFSPFLHQAGHGFTSVKTQVCYCVKVYSILHVLPKVNWLFCTKRMLIKLQNKEQILNIVAAFRGMHVSPAKHSYAWLPRKCDYRTDTRTDRQTPDKVIPMCHYASQATQKLWSFN